MAEILKTHADGKKARFAARTGLRTDQVNRWVESLPGGHDSLVLWAQALGLPWQTIVTAEDASAAVSAQPKLIPPPGPSGVAPVRRPASGALTARSPAAEKREKKRAGGAR